MKKLFKNLTFWVLTAIIAGAILGHFAPTIAVQMQPLGKYFIEVVKLFIYPIIFLTISLGISGMGNLKKVGRVGGKALLYFEIVTTFALLIGIVTAWIIKPGSGLQMNNLKSADITQYTNAAQAFSWLQFLKDNITIQVLLISIFFGLCLGKFSNAKKITELLTTASKYVFKVCSLYPLCLLKYSIVWRCNTHLLNQTNWLHVQHC